MKNSLPLKRFLKENAEILDLIYPEAQDLQGEITCGILQRPGLILAGVKETFKPGAVQFFGEEETAYLRSLEGQARRETLEQYLSLRPVAVIIQSELLLNLIIEHFKKKSVPLFRCRAQNCYEKINQYLHWKLSERKTVHGELLGIYGLGVLITGESGIGKSEIALELITRGHMFVADDLVEVLRLPGGNIVGKAPDRARGFMEVRGLGIISVNDIFGGALLPFSPIDLILELVPFKREMERLSVEEEKENLLGVEIPKFKIPVAAGRNIANLVEVAVRLFILKSSGEKPLEEFLRRIQQP